MALPSALLALEQTGGHFFPFPEGGKMQFLGFFESGKADLLNQELGTSAAG